MWRSKYTGGGVQKDNGCQRLAGIGRSLERALRVLVGPAAGAAYRVNGVAGHLRAQVRKPFAQHAVGQVVQGHAVPATVQPSNVAYPVAGLSKLMLKGLQTGMLLVVAGEWDAKYGIHIGRESTPSYMKCKLLI